MIVPKPIQTKFLQMVNDGCALDLQKKLALKDVSLWSDDPIIQQSISQRLGWIDCIDPMLLEVESILKTKNEIIERGFRHCVLLGMGGSSLAPELFSLFFSPPDQDDHLTLEVADNTSPDAVHRLATSIDYNETLFIVASKSGTTIESDSLFRYFYEQVSSKKHSDPGQNFLAITDSDTKLARLAKENNFLHCFVNPADIGGRFSVLSYFGLVPAALIGVDIRHLLTSANNELMSCQSKQQVSSATQLGIILGLAEEQRLDKLFIKFNPELKPFAAWLEQLIAESTGKAAKGMLPIIDEQENSDYYSTHNFKFTLANRILEQENPPITSQFFDITNLGAEFYKWEWATAIAGAVMNINPFDEPNVGQNKKITTQLLGSNDKSDELFVTNDLDSVVYDGSPDSKRKVHNNLQLLLKGHQLTDYFAILMYTSNDNKAASLMLNFRAKLTDRIQIPSTFGIGPRYLHSTGQLHKGGLNNGIFLIITTAFSQKIAIPGESYNFGELNRAQAAGDIQALKSNQRRFLHIHLSRSDDQTLESFVDTLIQAIG